MKSALDCTIIILSFNSRVVTDECLRRLRAAAKESEKTLKNDITVIVVDNGSVDGSAAMIRKKYPWVRLIALERNIGYAAGNNLAMKKINTPFFILMNSDTFIETDTLVKAFRHRDMVKDESDAFFGKWVNENGAFHTYGGSLPTPLRIIVWSFGFESLPLIKYFLPRIYSRNPWFYKKGGKLEWGPPCFMFAKKEVYDHTGGFDDRLWFHMVDVEWCQRIKQHGFTLSFAPDIQMVHLEGASSKGLSEELLRDNFKALLYFCKKHFPQNVKEVVFFVKLGLRMRGMIYALLGKRNVARMYLSIPQTLTV